jgi:LPXTG-site transpeptidase (sortase) family protein
VQRSIIPLPRTRDRQTGAWTWNTNRLFRPGRPDLVGHWEGSASPGETGNVILVGHNYGYGYNGVFVRLASLRKGQKVHIVNQAGKTFTYEVVEVKKLRWRRQSLGELTQHLNYLSPGGPERVTLVSCAGADMEPFPERVYVVAEPQGTANR